MRRLRALDQPLLLVTIFLLGLGLVQVYSSSFIFAFESFGDGLYFFRRQLMFSIAGLVILLLIACLPWRFFQRFGWFLWVMALVGIALTYVPSIGVSVGGSHRWIQMIPGFRFEPAEMLKITIPFFLGWYISRREQWVDYKGHLVFVVGLIVMAMLLHKQPDFGTLFICAVITLMTLFAYGLSFKYIAAALALSVPSFYFLVVQVPYRYARIVGYIDPWSDPSKKGFQIIQSLLSFHSGGFWGAGLGQGQGKLFFLPEAHTDFTFAVLGEELGFVGVFFVTLVFGFLMARGFQIAMNSKDRLRQVVALGVTLSLALNIFINMGVVLGLLPTKGLTLPFLSYGGSSLISTCFAIGLLLNIEKEEQRQRIKSFRGLDIS